jgi:DNA replication and repair protein RecF
VELVSLETWCFRNLADHTLSWAPGVTLVVGGNGQGKTNLLEAVAVLGNVRSFRTVRARRLVRHGEVGFRLRGVVRSGSDEVEIKQVVESGQEPRRSLTVNRVEVELGDYLATFPVFVLAPGDRELVVGGPELRRAFVDRVAFLLRPDHLAALRSYARALRQRSAALLAGASDSELEGWERQLACHGARVVTNRCHAVATLDAVFGPLYEAIGHRDRPPLSVSYRGDLEALGEADLERAYRQRYNENRVRDRGAGMTFDGPHRHDLALRAGGRAVRDVLSSGQTKVVAAALRLASLAVVETARDAALPLVIDDVDAELDGEAVERLMTWVGDRRQTSVSSVNERLAGRTGRTSVIRMRDGHGQPAVCPGDAP